MSLIVADGVAGVAEKMHPRASDDQGQQDGAAARLQVLFCLPLVSRPLLTGCLNLSECALVIFGRKPAVIMIVGVNGGGKTTSLGSPRYAVLDSHSNSDFNFVAGRNAICFYFLVI